VFDPAEGVGGELDPAGHFFGGRLSDLSITTDVLDKRVGQTRYLSTTLHQPSHMQ
jgi:hypothetical protein